MHPEAVCSLQGSLTISVPLLLLLELETKAQLLVVRLRNITPSVSASVSSNAKCEDTKHTSRSPHSPGLPAVGYQGWKYFLRVLEPRVVPAAGS